MNTEQQCSSRVNRYVYIIHIDGLFVCPSVIGPSVCPCRVFDHLSHYNHLTLCCSLV